jgi:hypothetical protein
MADAAGTAAPACTAPRKPASDTRTYRSIRYVGLNNGALVMRLDLINVQQAFPTLLTGCPTAYASRLCKTWRLSLPLRQ